MISAAADLARRLARNAEAVCRHYLSNGRRRGRYWIVGDVKNTPGRSLYVRLHGPETGPGAAGKWTDAATGEHGDLLDLIALNRALHRLGEVMGEARFFLALPDSCRIGERAAPAPAHSGSPTGFAGADRAARRLFRAGRPIAGTPAEAYLRARGIIGPLDWPVLRYHPSVFYRETESSALEIWPALLAAVTDNDGRITGIQRTWLDPLRWTKAPLADPRRALGHLLSNGVRFGKASDILAAGEGLETMLALKSVLPSLPMIAGLSANHLAGLERTLFTLDWIEDPELRRGTSRELNKGESRNSLARAVFIHRLGEIRDRTYEDQQHRASGLNLLVTAIILWNTRYLDRATTALRAVEEVPEEILVHLSPLGWEHVNLTGDYVCSPADRATENPDG